MDITFRHIHAGPDTDFTAVRNLLADDDLFLDADVEIVVAAFDAAGKLAGCAALARDVAKCIAIRRDVRGEGLALPLMNELTALAWDMGRHDLFLYTKPAMESLFFGCGFITLAKVPDAAVLMENNKLRLKRYCDSLAAFRVPGAAIAGLVMNCNPFTLGHQYLVEHASRNADHVHLFVVREDRSLFPYMDRLQLVKEGVAHLPNVTVHPGSVYIISRATFPAYFIHDASAVDRAYTGIDIQIFRAYIAPALGITHRFVGTEPLSAVTKRYNDDMAHWLATPDLDAPPIAFTVIPRLEVDGQPVSASRVRDLWKNKGVQSVKSLVPQSTFEYLETHAGLIGKD